MPSTASSAKRGAALAIGLATVGWIVARSSRRSALGVVSPDPGADRAEDRSSEA